MAQHLLSLDIPDTLTSCVLRIVDTSTYNEYVPLECPKLEITGPGFTTASVTELEIGWNSFNVTACGMDIQLTNCDSYRNDIQDGVYVIKYSVAPHEVVNVEYNHLRITAALNVINNLLCCLDVPNCEPLPPLAAKLREVQLLSTMLQAAKARVEYCHNPSQGMAMYNYVLAKLKKLSCGCGCEAC
jgi:hypothetical protein